jgi:HK97 family phage major capsid protein
MTDMLEFPALKEALGKLDAKNRALHGIFSEAGPEMDMAKVKSLDGDSAAKVEAIRSLNEEIDATGAEVDRLKAVARAAARSKEWDGGQEKGTEQGDLKARGGSQVTKSLGDMFVESMAFKGKQGAVGPEVRLDITLKALFDTTAVGTPETVRGPRIVDYVTRPIQLLDIVPQTTTSQAAVVYMEETGFTNNAGEILEGAPYPESALALTERTSPVRKIGTWIPVTDETLEDEPRARAYINNRLPFMVRQRLDGQLLSGNGTAPSLTGLLNTAGIQTQAKGADPIPDAIYKAMTKVKVNGLALPDVTVWNPFDWQIVRLLRTSDGIYIWGNPSEPGPARIWGLPVVEAFGLTAGTAVVGDFGNYSELAVRRGIDVQISNSHADFFTNGKQAIRADIRAALIFYRPKAFATVTGIA